VLINDTPPAGQRLENVGRLGQKLLLYFWCDKKGVFGADRFVATSCVKSCLHEEDKDADEKYVAIAERQGD
jgi:hypothetical protein